MEINQELINLGQEAQRFKEYIYTNDYFLMLIERMKSRHKDNILKLQPYDTELFKIMKTQLDTLDWFVQGMEADIAVAMMEANKSDEKVGGIL